MSTIQKIKKIAGQKGSGLGHVTYISISRPFYSSGMAKDRNLKFGVHIDHDEYYSKNKKIKGQKGVA